jgi:PAS domain S-box-containing protein
MLYVGPAYEQIWGRSTQGLYQQSTDFIEAVNPDDRPCMYTMLDQHTRGEHSIIEYRIVRPNGEVRWILYRAFPFRDHPRNGYRVAGVAEDITERKQAEEALRQMNDILEQPVTERIAALSAANTELSKATRLKDESLASMSHELLTPLNATLELSEAVQEQLFGPLTDKQDQSLRRITESGSHLLALITDILDLSKIEAGKVHLTLTSVDVAGVCQASLRLIRESARKNQQHVTSHVDPAVSTLLAEERRLKQMLVNLLHNAVKFTYDHWCIGLEVMGHPDGQLMAFTVWDAGIGIAVADRGRLFQPFVQLDSSLARHHAGTGGGHASRLSRSRPHPRPGACSPPPRWPRSGPCWRLSAPGGSAAGVAASCVCVSALESAPGERPERCRRRDRRVAIGRRTAPVGRLFEESLMYV